MFTLSDASYDTKQFLKWFGIGIAVLICLFFLVKAILFIKEVIAPTPPPRPTVAFGKLQPAIFPVSKIDKKLTFTVNTVSGELPTFANQVKVYVINPNEPDLLALNKMQSNVSGGGFGGKPIELSDKVYRWSSDPGISSILTVFTGDIVDSSFTIDSDFMTNSAILSEGYPSNQSRTVDLTNNYLDGMNFLRPDLDLTKTKTKLFAIQNNALVPATSLSTTQIIEVDYFQKDVDELPIYYEDATSSNIVLLVAGGGGSGQVVNAKYVNQQVSDRSSTYPIISPTEALARLKAGNAFISAYSGSSDNVSITDLFLAYYISSKPQDFAIPIYVFVGNDGFYGYVTAVKDEWISK